MEVLCPLSVLALSLQREAASQTRPEVTFVPLKTNLFPLLHKQHSIVPYCLFGADSDRISSFCLRRSWLNLASLSHRLAVLFSKWEIFIQYLKGNYPIWKSTLSNHLYADDSVRCVTKSRPSSLKLLCIMNHIWQKKKHEKIARVNQSMDKMTCPPSWNLFSFLLASGTADDVLRQIFGLGQQHCTRLPRHIFFLLLCCFQLRIAQFAVSLDVMMTYYSVELQE